ncbi:zeta toxin family protein [Nocardia sp. BSTN01]|nr:zeta toxin family protein [Nocardia sp. BSTN01]
MAIDHIIANHEHVILEEGAGNIHRAVDVMRRFQRNTYGLRAEAVAVSEVESRLSIPTRFLDERTRSGVGRYVPTKAHDMCFTGSAELVRSLESKTPPVAVDVVRVRSRTGVLFESHCLPSGEWNKQPEGWEAMQHERNRPLTPAEERAYADKLQGLRDGIDAGRRLYPGEEKVWNRLSDEADQVEGLARPGLQL